jgi:hypothetical protein
MNRSIALLSLVALGLLGQTNPRVRRRIQLSNGLRLR